FSQRVYAFDVTKQLKAGANLLAVEVNNQSEPLLTGIATAAGLTAQLTVGGQAVLTTDETWKGAPQAADGWQMPSSGDGNWKPVQLWPSDGTTWPWTGSVWEPLVLEQLARKSIPPLTVNAGGNWRDYFSAEGYPFLDTQRGLVLDETADPKMYKST